MNNFLGFPKNLIASVVCQADKAVLRSENDLGAANIMNGYLVCSFCRRRYEIKDGILDLLAGQAGLDDILKSEIKARDGDAAGYNKRLAARYYKEVFPTIKNLGNLKEKKLIEYGCGTGRLTLEIEKNCQEILAIDFSRQSLLRLASNLKSNKTGLVLADATQIRTKENYFDLALATQFFEHIPSDRQKENFLLQSRQTLKGAGEIICTVYHNDWRRRLKKLPKEGFHSGKIYYHYFDRNELKAIFKKYFKINKIQLIDITLPLETRLKLPEKLGGIISRLSQSLFPINRLGHLLLIKASHEAYQER